MQQPFIKLNKNTLISSIGLGTAELRGDNCIRTIKNALNIGYRHLDTAESYMNESEIGQSIKSYNRKDIFITTKISPIDLDYYKVLAACEESLARLETHYLDLYLIHWPDKSLNINFKEILKSFKRLYELGKIKAFGVSNFEISHLKYTIQIANEINLPVLVNQIEFNPLLYPNELLDFCNQNKIIITSYSPLARGLIFNNQIMINIGNKHNKSAGQISLKWLLDKGTVIIPKTSSIQHLKENLNLEFDLSNKDIKIIDNIYKNEKIIKSNFSDFCK